MSFPSAEALRRSAHLQAAVFTARAPHPCNVERPLRGSSLLKEKDWAGGQSPELELHVGRGYAVFFWVGCWPLLRAPGWSLVHCEVTTGARRGGTCSFRPLCSPGTGHLSGAGALSQQMPGGQGRSGLRAELEGRRCQTPRGSAGPGAGTSRREDWAMFVAGGREDALGTSQLLLHP